MLIQSSLANSIREPLSIVFEHGKQENLDSPSDWTNYSKIQQNFPNCGECHWDGCRKSASTRSEKDNAAIPKSILDSVAHSSLSANEDTRPSSAPGRNDQVYKRRKKNKNYVDVFSKLEAMNNTKRDSSLLSSISSDKCSPNEQRCNDLNSRFQREIKEFKASVVPVVASETEIHPQKAVSLDARIDDSMNLGIASKPDSMNGISFGVKGGILNANNSCSSSKSDLEHDLAVTKTEADDTAECSSSDFVVSEILRKRLSEKEQYVTAKSCSSVDNVGTEGDIRCSRTCKICNLLDNPQKMLICDLCEEAFHLSCCKPQVKQIPVDEWYCQSCIKKKPKPLLGITTPGKKLDIKKETSEYRKRDYGPILFMLNDTEPYATGVRIGKAFQADVPDWSVPIFNDSTELSEPLLLDPLESVNMNEWNSNQSSGHSSIGNWLQCREIMYKNPEDDVGVVCGKWRRAPLFEVQTDDWDCSCAVVWDPIHADCAVPQELDTAEVMMHLKYIQMLRPRLDSKKFKLGHTKSSGRSDL